MVIILVWPHRVRHSHAQYEGGASDVNLMSIWRMRKKAVFPPTLLSFGGKTVVLAWKIPWAEEPGRLQFMWLQRVGQGWASSLSLSLDRAPCLPTWISYMNWTELSRSIFSATFKKHCLSSSLTTLQPQTGFLAFLKAPTLSSRAFASAVPSASSALLPGFPGCNHRSNVVSPEGYFLTTTLSDLLWPDHYHVFSFSSFIFACTVFLTPPPTNCRLHDSRNCILSLLYPQSRKGKLVGKEQTLN